MHRWLCLAVILAGCASGPPEQYHRGTFTPPPPAPVRPGVGLPTYDPHVKPLPPQPQPKPKRLLPPTREPGIWASDAPESPPDPLDDGEPAPLVLGIRLPYPDEPSSLMERENVRWCAARSRGALGLALPQDIVLTDKERMCLAMRMYALCATRVWRPQQTNEALTPRERRSMGDLAHEAGERFVASCINTPDADTDRVKGVFKDAAAEWYGVRP
jgi:hypothetical protein